VEAAVPPEQAATTITIATRCAGRRLILCMRSQQGRAQERSTPFTGAAHSRTVMSSNDEDDQWLRITHRSWMRRRWQSCWA
jgi:hypothetical protein